jgi:DNA-binding CsgD family transcriptional regulator
MTRTIFNRLKQIRLKRGVLTKRENNEEGGRFLREALIEEREIIKLKYDRLREEMINRDKELANQTMGIIQKNRFLAKVNEDLNGIQDFVINDTAKRKIQQLKNRIKKEIDNKQQNKIFETYFGEVHDGFFKKLKERYPDLSSYDLRLCAYIRMNLTTREIANILNISYRGAEISRYRLRKKLELDRSTSLSAFLTCF